MAEDDRPIALDAYEKLAEGYAAKAPAKAENGYNEHPAMRRVIGDVAGLRVFDAGCGPGFLTRDLLDKGAAFLAAVDVSPAMVRLATARAGEGADIHLADLAKPMPFLETDDFDLVVSSLAIDYVRDWRTPLSEFVRILRPGGRLVFSVQHPTASYEWLKPPSAFGVHYCEVKWTSFTDQPVTVPDYYRSFEEIVNPVLAAGFRIARIEETRPLPELQAINPYKFHRNDTFPTFMIIDAQLS